MTHASMDRVRRVIYQLIVAIDMKALKQLDPMSYIYLAPFIRCVL